MFQCLISWRRNLFMLMLMLLFLYSFTSHSKQLCCGWQFENRHISGKGFQVIRCFVTVPVQCGYFQFLFRKISFAIGKRLIITVLYYLLIAVDGLWVKIFKYFISRVIMSDDCRIFSFSWEEIIGSEEKTLKIRVGVSLHSALKPETVSELSACPEKIRITENSEILPLPHLVKTVQDARSSGTMILLPVIRRRTYNFSVEDEIRKFYNSLSEKDKRLYTGIEAIKLGHGGIVYIADVLRCSRKTVSKGIE